MQRNRFHGKWQYLFIESICNDPHVLEQNYRYKMMYSPDYMDCDTDAVRWTLCVARPMLHALGLLLSAYHMEGTVCNITTVMMAIE